MLFDVNPQGNLVTENPEDYYSINPTRREIAHMVNGEMKSYISNLSDEDLGLFINLEEISFVEKEFDNFNPIINK